MVEPNREQTATAAAKVPPGVLDLIKKKARTRPRSRSGAPTAVDTVVQNHLTARESTENASVNDSENPRTCEHSKKQSSKSEGAKGSMTLEKSVVRGKELGSEGSACEGEVLQSREEALSRESQVLLCKKRELPYKRDLERAHLAGQSEVLPCKEEESAYSKEGIPRERGIPSYEKEVSSNEEGSVFGKRGVKPRSAQESLIAAHTKPCHVVEKSVLRALPISGNEEQKQSGDSKGPRVSETGCPMGIDNSGVAKDTHRISSAENSQQSLRPPSEEGHETPGEDRRVNEEDKALFLAMKKMLQQEMGPKIKWECAKCMKECIPVREQSRCICGHRLKDHPAVPPKTSKFAGNNTTTKPFRPFACVSSRCECPKFFYIVAEGAWILRCRCKHRHTDHDSAGAPFRCRKPKCKCDGFDSPWVCNCNHPWGVHTQSIVQNAEAPSTALAETEHRLLADKALPSTYDEATAYTSTLTNTKTNTLTTTETNTGTITKRHPSHDAHADVHTFNELENVMSEALRVPSVADVKRTDLVNEPLVFPHSSSTSN